MTAPFGRILMYFPAWADDAYTGFVVYIPPHGLLDDIPPSCSTLMIL